MKILCDVINIYFIQLLFIIIVLYNMKKKNLFLTIQKKLPQEHTVNVTYHGSVHVAI